mgnify:FL=1
MAGYFIQNHNLKSDEYEIWSKWHIQEVVCKLLLEMQLVESPLSSLWAVLSSISNEEGWDNSYLSVFCFKKMKELSYYQIAYPIFLSCCPSCNTMPIDLCSNSWIHAFSPSSSTTWQLSCLKSYYIQYPSFWWHFIDNYDTSCIDLSNILSATLLWWSTFLFEFHW